MSQGHILDHIPRHPITVSPTTKHASDLDRNVQIEHLILGVLNPLNDQHVLLRQKMSLTVHLLDCLT